MLSQANIETVYRFTLVYLEKLVADIADDELARQPHAGMNHPAWVLGHLALGSDFVGLLLGHALATDEAWMKTYGPGSTPVADRASYPSKTALLDKNRALHARALTLLATARLEQLSARNETPFFPDQFPAVGDLLTHIVTTHACLHLGQLSAWRRVMGKPSVLGV